MSGLLERLSDRGWRLTAQRRAVVTALRGDNVHLTADEVLDRARRVLPDTSRATVYNTLNELVDMGEIGELSLDGRSKRYDPNVRRPHHHLLCDGCGELHDVHVDADTPIPELSAEERQKFAVTGLDLLFSGQCPDCR